MASGKRRLERHVEPEAIILIAGGMCSKVLIDEITNDYDVTFIDLGCSFGHAVPRSQHQGLDSLGRRGASALQGFVA